MPMLGPIRATRVFITAAPAEAVWAALEDAPRWPQALTDLTAARIEPDGVLRAGATIRTVARPGTRAVDMTYRVVAAAPPHALTIESAIPGDARARTAYTIEPERDGARVTVTSEAAPARWLHKITTALARRFYTRQLEAALDARVAAMLTLAEGRNRPA